MLKDSLFFFNGFQEDENSNRCYSIILNQEHEIFKAHFPGNPIVPGVCLLEIARATASDMSKRELRIKNIKILKFIASINPNQHPTIQVKLELKQKEDFSNTKLTIFDNETIFAKSDIQFE